MKNKSVAHDGIAALIGYLAKHQVDPRTIRIALAINLVNVCRATRCDRQQPIDDVTLAMETMDEAIAAQQAKKPQGQKH